MAKKIISLFLVLVMLCNLATPVMAKKAEVDSENSCTDITLKRIVEVEIAKNGKAILNITEVNKSLSEWIAETEIKGQKYRILVLPHTNSTYIIKILNSRNLEIWSGVSNYNPIENLGERTYRLSVPIPPDAYLDIYPDKYSYRKGENGIVTLFVDNGGVTIGYTSYFIIIPQGVTYNGVLDGPQLIAKIHLTETNGCYPVPEYGVVCGKGELLFWQAVHLSGYKKQVVLDVTYTNSGKFKFEAGTAVVDAIIGWGDVSSDSFTVTVS
ncbi:MAG: hypothetical protein QFX40_02385 [Archaeoglobales archaeon]|nr:hypothetical protein [Archaeoglobales archaeon]